MSEARDFSLTTSSGVEFVYSAADGLVRITRDTSSVSVKLKDLTLFLEEHGDSLHDFDLDRIVTSNLNDAATLMGMVGGTVGGVARAAKLSPERRKEIARKAAEARWSKAREREGG